MALVRPQPTRIKTAGLFIIDGQPIVFQGPDGLPEIPPIAVLMPRTRRWRKVKPCGTIAAWRRHQRRGEPIDDKCRAARSRWLRRQRARARRARRDTPKRKPAGSACTDARRPA
jgi:hypothetical protein